MSTFTLEQDNDLSLSGGQLVLEKDEVVAGAIELFQRFQMFLGEWFLDTRIGVPYFQTFFVKNPDLDIIKRIISRTVASIDIVASVDEVQIEFDSTNRSAIFFFSATADDGRSITGGSGTPFIVEDV